MKNSLLLATLDRALLLAAILERNGTPGERRVLDGLAIPPAIRGVLEKALARGQALNALADCVIAQACDTIADILAEAAVAPAFAKESEKLVQPLQKIITEWIGEQALKKAQGLIKDSAAKACEERMKR